MAQMRGGRPKKDKTKRLNTQVNMRLKDDLVAMLDAKSSALEALHLGSTWSRSDVARYMIYKAFQAEHDD